MKSIGIVCEGPTDYAVLSRVIDTILGGHNHCLLLQPEADLTGRFGNGWKGVLKWCTDNAAHKRQLMEDIQPALDILVIQMDGDVSRKDKPSHCACAPVACAEQGDRDPVYCDTTKCPIVLPCGGHSEPVAGYVEHLKGLITSRLIDTENTCIVIPCDSTESWIVAAYDDDLDDVERLEDAWEQRIAKGKSYHGIRIPGKKKRVRHFEQFATKVCQNWTTVTQRCQSAKAFEADILALL